MLQIYHNVAPSCEGLRLLSSIEPLDHKGIEPLLLGGINFNLIYYHYMNNPYFNNLCCIKSPSPSVSIIEFSGFPISIYFINPFLFVCLLFLFNLFCQFEDQSVDFIFTHLRVLLQLLLLMIPIRSHMNSLCPITC